MTRQQQFEEAMAKGSQQRVQPDILQALETRLTDISKAMRENRTIAAYELIRQLQEFVSYERAKHSAQ
jgi:hypothetical protein